MSLLTYYGLLTIISLSEEHRRRSSGCVFFTWKAPPKKPIRRASRLSTQSAATSIDWLDDEPVKKTARTRKPKRGAMKEMSVDPEPITEQQPVQPPRGRKRSSSVAQVTGPVVIYDGGKDTDEDEPRPPPAKRRATRASLAIGQDRDTKMVDSDNESVIVARPVKAPAKKTRRSTSRTRGSQRPMSKSTRALIQDDEEIDRALALDLERPLTDDEDLTSYKKPFIRSTKRLTRSRTSIVAAERIRDAPDGVLIPSVRKGDTKPWTPAGDSGATQRSPTKGLFKEGSQDFSMPIVIPRHLAQAPDNEDTYRGPEKKRHGGVVDKAQVDPSSTGEPEVKRPAPKKTSKGRKAAVVQEADASKPKKKPTTKKGPTIRSRSNSATSQPELPAPSQVSPGRNLVDGLSFQSTGREELSSEAPIRSKQSRKPKVSKGKRASAMSTMSVSSSLQDAIPMSSSFRDPIPMSSSFREQTSMSSSFRDPIPMSSSFREPISMSSSFREPISISSSFREHVPAPVPKDEPKAVARAPGAEADPKVFSDVGSVVTHNINHQKAVKPAPERLVKDIAPPSKPKRSRKVAAPAPAKKRPTRSSAISAATDLAVDSVGSGAESDASRVSTGASGERAKKGSRKVAKKATQSRNIEDILKKGSENFFASSQSEEFTNAKEAPKKGRAPRKLMGAIEVEPRGSARAAQDPDQTEDEAKPPTKATRTIVGRIVSFTEKVPPKDLYPGSDTEIDEVQPPSSPRPRSRPAALPLSPARMPQSPARIPLSPVRTQITVQDASTPKRKPSGKLISSKPWTAVDLDTVFQEAGEHGADEEIGLGERERDMTVAEWVKWNAAKGEERLVREAERLIEIFRKEGARAIEAIEGIETI